MARIQYYYWKEGDNIPMSGVFEEGKQPLLSQKVEPPYIQSPVIVNGVVVESISQDELDAIAFAQALEAETAAYKKRQCDGVDAYAKISAEFRLAKLNAVITEEAHAVIEQTLIVVRNEVLSGQWISARLELEKIGSTIIGVELYDRLHLQISDYITLNY